MIYTKAYSPPKVNRKEALRYAGVKEAELRLEALLQSCLEEVEPMLAYKVCYGEFPVSVREGVVDLGFARVRSADLAGCFENVDRAVIFAATVGVMPDRLIARYSVVSPAKAVMLDALGTERIESLCDVFCRELAQGAAEKGLCTTPRFSPGYGDLPLLFQKELFQVLDCPKRIGLSLNESLLMSPSKSVTALVGLRSRSQGERKV